MSTPFDKAYQDAKARARAKGLDVSGLPENYQGTTFGDVGRWAEYAAPIFGGITLGPVAGAAAGAGVAALRGRDPLAGAAEGYGLGSVGALAAAPPPGGDLGGTFDSSTPPDTFASAPTVTPVTDATIRAAAPKGALSAIGSFLTKDPRTIPNILGTAADIYGAIRQGDALDREEQLKRDIANADVHAGGLNVRQPYDAWMAERARLRQKYGQ